MSANKTNPADQAFPRSYAYMNPQAGKSELVSVHGLTKREYFAALAMQGLLERWDYSLFDTKKDGADESERVMAIRALGMADALIAELNKPKEKEYDTIPCKE